MPVGYALDLVRDVHSCSVSWLLEALVCCFEHCGAEVAWSQTTRSSGVCLFAPGELGHLILYLLYKPHCVSV